ncbi:conserved hypothetical protein [Talaromyces stipitatus ATCC 10500]|uniref:DUF7137 domain-containing protein n=1 Tax=Talaromyces stipitatus (strain ATCC 10500 / CBS 375.48 / QM 6759 / NRRL 1006) TaxID=441959 RepID=B8MAY6_TALSN|nr:uncharacterized protein TSTA_124150 [Talaromyces stipitatus ATCC 10500]EED18687.1 conserved hypothetical protein [Talaromyces stipitatus ATCC 10500]
MRSFTLLSLLISLMLLASVVGASRNMYDDILARDSTTATDSATNSATNSATDSTTDSATDSASNSQSQTASGTDTASDQTTGTAATTGTATGTGSSTQTTTGGTKTTSTHKTTSISVDPEWPAGGASMTNPPSTSTTYYKIGQNVTLGWNYTSLHITPSAVDVIASCSSNSATYTLANNVSFANATSVVWETDQYGPDSQSPLLTAHYTLIIYEAGTSPTQVASPGQLGPASYTFAMYSTQSYTPLASYVCVTCNSAVSIMDRQALGFILGMAAITIFSFTSFAGGFGLF